MSAREPNTPGFLGYVASAVIAFVVCGLFVTLGIGVATGFGFQLIGTYPLVVLTIAVAGSPVAIAGILPRVEYRRSLAAWESRQRARALVGGP